MGKILVTGLGGFTGAYVKSSFESKGYEIVGLVQSEKDRRGPSDIVCDLTGYESVVAALRGEILEGVIHLAAISFVAHSNPLDFYGVNVIGTQNLLEALRETQKNLKKVILASSANVYGLAGGESGISERTPVAPVNHYAISKAGMEFMASTYFDDLPIIITRPFNYTGPGQDPSFLVPKIVSHYRDGEKRIALGNLDVSRDFSDVRDIAEMYLGLYESEEKSRIFNLCSGTAYSIGEIVEFMNGIAGYDAEVFVNPDFVRKNEIMILKGDNSELKKAIRLKPPIAFRQTLTDLYQRTA
ncbi:MAG: NAD-dependent epimerase/dehydratase family protein [Candidatus Moranbacteria bacterium]|nr:NAD-dependent epimerase/dehydratase family protein [Candidatus Moranbacteria bacterium]